MQQQPLPTMNSASQIPPHAMTTEQIQKCLDDNKNLILAILENQNLGKLNECAQYQALLQKNLMYLAAIADAQPQPPQPPQGQNPSQMPPNSVPPQATQYMQQPQPGNPQQQQGGGPQKLPFQLNALRPDQQQQLIQYQQQQQQMQQAQMGMRPPPGMQQNAMLGMHHQSMQAGLGTLGGGLMDARGGGGGGKQDGQEAASGGGGGDGQGKSTSGRGSGNRDS